MWPKTATRLVTFLVLAANGIFSNDDLSNIYFNMYKKMYYNDTVVYSFSHPCTVQYHMYTSLLYYLLQPSTEIQSIYLSNDTGHGGGCGGSFLDFAIRA